MNIALLVPMDRLTLWPGGEYDSGAGDTLDSELLGYRGRGSGPESARVRLTNPGAGCPLVGQPCGFGYRGVCTNEFSGT